MIGRKIKQLKIKTQAIKVTLFMEDFERFERIGKDMNIDIPAVLAKKMILDAVKNYEKEHPGILLDPNYKMAPDKGKKINEIGKANTA